MSKALFASIALTTSLAFVGTGATSRPAHGKAVTKTSGSIKGVIHFDGKAPKRAVVDNSSDPVCAASKVLADAVIVNKGKLQDVHVRIKNGTAGIHKAPTSPVVVTQDGCVYRPHIIGAMVGQAVAISNDDKTMHNVHAYISGETWFNRSQPAGAPKIVETETGEAGEVFELKCDVHPWMHTYLPITDHPYFDVSAKDGSFEISKLPTGKYTLEAWHPTLGLKSRKIVVGKKSSKVSFHYP